MILSLLILFLVIAAFIFCIGIYLVGNKILLGIAATIFLIIGISLYGGVGIHDITTESRLNTYENVSFGTPILNTTTLTTTKTYQNYDNLYFDGLATMFLAFAFIIFLDIILSDRNSWMEFKR